MTDDSVVLFRFPLPALTRTYYLSYRSTPPNVSTSTSFDATLPAPWADAVYVHR